MNIRVKNIILPYEALSNFDLIDAVKDLKIKCFRGVYLLDTIPAKPRGEVFCGHLCLYVLKELNEGEDFQSILNKLY